LPFGAKVKVTCLKNSKSVIVRINDRGPHVRGRIIDLSYAAAKKIGLVKLGTAKVKLEVLP
jgi:rare lipoprotein A